MSRNRSGPPRLATQLGFGIALAVAGVLAGQHDGAASPGAGTDAFVANGPYRVHYWSQGAGEPLVLLHGLFGSADVWRELAPVDALAEEWNVIAMDLRGHGESSKPESPSHYGREMASDVIALLDELGIERAHVLGYSYGGLVVGELLATHPERIASAILGGCSRQDPARPRDLAWSRQLADALEAGNGTDWLAAALGGAEADPEAAQRDLVERRIASADPDVMVAVLRATDSLVVPDEVLEANRVPILALVGEDDPSSEEVRAMAAITSEMSVATIPGANHAEAPRTDLFWQYVTTFLRGHVSGSFDPQPARRSIGSPEDLASISALHRQDMEASRNKDYEALAALWSEDIVVLPPDAPITRGRRESVAAIEAIARSLAQVDILDYRLEFEELVVTGRFAFEWGAYRGRLRPAPGEPAIEQTGKLMRILERRDDGTWAIARTIYN